MTGILILSLVAAACAALPHFMRPAGAAIAAALAAVIAALLALVGVRPTLAVDSFGLYAYGSFFLVASGALASLALNRAAPLVLSAAAVVTGAILVSVTWSTAFHAESYRTLMEVEEVAYDGTVPLLAQERVQLVDENRARIRASEVLGSDQGLGSQYDYGSFFLQVVNGQPTWVAPLRNNRFWAKLMGEPSPGYVTVDATDARQVRLVTGRPLAVHGPGESFLNAVDRLLWFGGFAGEFLTDYSLEIDDAGTPHWVVTAYEPTIGWNGDKVRGVVVVNAATGETAFHPVSETPAWVDLVEPSDISYANLRHHGELVHGWLNSMFSGKDVIVPTEDGGRMSVVHMADGSSRWYTGMETVGAKNGGTSGFALVDTRTGKATVYVTAGISERTAREVIEGAYQADEYDATEPRLYLVDGRPTLVSLVTDAGGNVRGVGMVAQETRAVFGKGTDVAEARRAYVAAWRRNSAGSLATAGSEQAVAEFAVARIGFETVDGNSNAVILSPERDAPLYVVPLRDFRRAAVTREGDRVSISHAPAPVGDAVAQSFRNLSLEGTPAATAAPSAP